MTAQYVKEIPTTWDLYLIAAAAIYNKLAAGALGNDAAMRWFNQKKNERKNDPLLRYLHQALTCPAFFGPIISCRWPLAGLVVTTSSWLNHPTEQSTRVAAGRTCWRFTVPCALESSYAKKTGIRNVFSPIQQSSS